MGFISSTRLRNLALPGWLFDLLPLPNKTSMSVSFRPVEFLGTEDFVDSSFVLVSKLEGLGIQLGQLMVLTWAQFLNPFGIVFKKSLA